MTASFSTGTFPDLILIQGVLNTGGLDLGSPTTGGKAYFAHSGGTLATNRVNIGSYTLVDWDNEWWTAVYDMGGTVNLMGPLARDHCRPFGLASVPLVSSNSRAVR